MKPKSDLLNQKLDLILWVSTIDDASIIEQIIQLRDNLNKDWWERLSKEEQHSIERGLKEVALKQVKPHSVFRKKYEKWL